MAGRLLTKSILNAIRVPVGAAGIHGRSRIGNREIVGFGINGQANYQDRADFPMPAVRFREDTAEIKALREKEKGDWRKLSIEEKKALYRSSFCQTFAEFEVMDDDWKAAWGYSLIIMSLSLWLYMFLKVYAFNPIPDSFSEENQKLQLKRMLDLQVNPVDGLSSKWDYENNRWKK